MHLTHAVRLISDVFAFFQVRLWVGYRYVQADPANLVAAFRRADLMMAGFGPVYENWLRTEYANQA